MGVSVEASAWSHGPNPPETKRSIEPEAPSSTNGDLVTLESSSARRRSRRQTKRSHFRNTPSLLPSIEQHVSSRKTPFYIRRVRQSLERMASTHTCLPQHFRAERGWKECSTTNAALNHRLSRSISSLFSESFASLRREFIAPSDRE